MTTPSSADLIAYIGLRSEGTTRVVECVASYPDTGGKRVGSAGVDNNWVIPRGIKGRRVASHAVVY